MLKRIGLFLASCAVVGFVLVGCGSSDESGTPEGKNGPAGSSGGAMSKPEATKPTKSAKPPQPD